AAMAAGCAHAPVAQAPAKGDVGVYYPLAVGNRWTYAAKLLGARSVQTVEILGRDGAFFKDSQNGELAVDPYGIRDKHRYLLRSPVERGTTWTNVVSVSSVEHYAIEAVGESCAS